MGIIFSMLDLDSINYDLTHCNKCHIYTPRSSYHCDACNKCVYFTQVHCFKCGICTNKNNYHCDICNKCINENKKHCLICHSIMNKEEYNFHSKIHCSELLPIATILSPKKQKSPSSTKINLPNSIKKIKLL